MKEKWSNLYHCFCLLVRICKQYLQYLINLIKFVQGVYEIQCGSESQSSSGNRVNRNVDVENAGDRNVQEYFKDVMFDSVAIWGTPLPDKTKYDILRVASLGAADLYNKIGGYSPGGTNHWAFVAWDSRRLDNQVNKVEISVV